MVSIVSGFLSLRWAMIQSLTTGADPERNHFGAYL